MKIADHFTPFYLLANCRRMASSVYRNSPNWVLASELFAVGSTTANRICREANIDPDGLEVRPSAPAPGGASENAQGHMKTNPPAAGRGEGDSHG